MSNSGIAAYQQPTRNGGSPRETEGRALLEAARRIAEAQKAADSAKILKAVRLNWRLWTIFQAEISAPTCTLPREVRQNMLTLCNFVDQRTVGILAEPKPDLLNVLINVNRNIAAGLLTNTAQQPGEGEADTEAPTRPAGPGEATSA